MNYRIEILENDDFRVVYDEYSGLPAVDAYKEKEIDPLEKYRREAMELWSDSCTTPRKKEE